MPVFAERYTSNCPRCEAPIALPRRSPLGTFEGHPSQPNPVWPINLLCIQTGQVSAYPLDKFRRERVQKPDQNRQTVVLWQIESPCAHESCRNRLFLYAWYRGDVSEEEMLNSAIHAKPKRRCGEHEFEWDTAKASVQKFDIW